MDDIEPILPPGAIVERVDQLIQTIRGERVMLDSDLAALYGVETRRLVEQVRRNPDRFPPDFMFQLSPEETASLRSQFAISKTGRAADTPNLRSQSVISSGGRGGRRYPPYAFSEQGVAMLSSVLNSPRAVAVNIEIMRAFVRIRALVASSTRLTQRLDELEAKYDDQFRVVFDAIRELMKPAGPPTRRLGFPTGGPA